MALELLKNNDFEYNGKGSVKKRVETVESLTKLSRYQLHLVVSQVIKDLRRSSSVAACLEPLDIFKHAWKYRGEGNANVVVALQDDQRVIRLSKVKVGEPIGDLAKHRRKVEREVIFANKVFGPLIGPEFLGSVKAIQLDGEQIIRLNGILQGIRPDHRLHKELRVPYATSHSDFARINDPTSNETDFCVEIKPKQGWWPINISMRNLSESNSSLCTYCTNQFLKLKRAKISSRTWYCPLDLFSGNPQRMIEAVTSLIANPQNNFRIFCNGKLVFGECNEESLETVLKEWMGNTDTLHSTEMPSALNSFVYLLCVSLLKPKYIPGKCGSYKSQDAFNEIARQLRKLLVCTPPSQLYAKIMSKRPMSKESVSEMCESDNIVKDQGMGGSCNRDAVPLPQGCILSRILEIQKLADLQKSLKRTDTSIYKIYKKICPVHSIGGLAEKNKLATKASSEYEFPTTPKLDMVLTGEDSYDNYADSGTETERMSDSESFEEGFDTSSTEDDEDETITSIINLDNHHNSSSSSKGESTPVTLNPSPSHLSHECPSAACLSSEKWLDEIEYLPLSDEEVMAVEMYLLAATAKDCSIMVTFSPVRNSCDDKEEDEGESLNYHQDLQIMDLGNRFHKVRIGVADLDPKPITTIVRHYLRDSEMQQAYSAYYDN